jgi:hypothetical protein
MRGTIEMAWGNLLKKNQQDSGSLNMLAVASHRCILRYGAGEESEKPIMTISVVV